MNIEERLTALELDRATLTRIASEQMLRLRDIEHNEAILLGVAQSQGQDIRQVKADVNDIKADVNDIKADVNDTKERLAGIESRLERIDERLDTLITMVKSMQPPTGQ